MLSSSYGLLALGTILLFGLKRYYGRLPVPPGPKGSLWTGVLHLLPASEPWKAYWSWSEHFGASIISFRVYNTRMVVLNDASSVTELMEKRAKIYSDRPRHSMFNEICGRKNTVFNISSLDNRHRHYRKLLHTGLNPLAVRDYWHIMETEVATLLNGIAECPGHLAPQLRRCSTAIIMKLAYGYSVTEDDRFINVAEQSAKISASAMTPGRWLVNHYPILRFVPSFLPGAGWKRQGLKWKQQLLALSDVPHHWVKEQMASGKFEPSFTSRHLQNNVAGLPVEEHEDIVKWCAGGLYAGATDTTLSALTSFIHLMAVYPHVQVKIQKELDDAFGSKGLPHPADLGKLSYLNAVFKEVLRFAPVANLGLAHKVVEEDEYDGHRIPKDSVIIANIWAIMNDPNLYPEPSVFSPDRFTTSAPLSKPTPYDQPQPDPRKFAYGFGRRSCPGINFAETMILLTMASILSRYEIALPPDEPAPVLEFTSGITSHIVPFSLSIRPRV